jgi:hypothetical protein
MESKGRNIGGWAYLVEKLQALGVSRRMAVHILNEVFREISLDLKRGKYVDLGFGCLKRVKKQLSKRWEMLDDEPMQPYTVALTVDAGGSRPPEMFFKTKWRCLSGRGAPGHFDVWGCGRILARSRGQERTLPNEVSTHL